MHCWSQVGSFFLHIVGVNKGGRKQAEKLETKSTCDHQQQVSSYLYQQLARFKLSNASTQAESGAAASRENILVDKALALFVN
jgi:hypothetical protein